MPASRTQQLATAERRAQNIALRVAGASWDKIAEQLGYAGRAAACRDFTRALEVARKQVRASAEVARETELLRYDRLQAAFWPAAIRGDVKAGKLILEISDRRVKLEDLTGEKKTLDNAVDAWIGHLGGSGPDGEGGLDADDAAALALVTA